MPVPVEVLVRAKIKRDLKRYMYYIDKDGNACRRKQFGDGAEEVLVKKAVKRESGYLYFIDEKGSICRSKEPPYTQTQKKGATHGSPKADS